MDGLLQHLRQKKEAAEAAAVMVQRAEPLGKRATDMLEEANAYKIIAQILIDDFKGFLVRGSPKGGEGLALHVDAWYDFDTIGFQDGYPASYLRLLTPQQIQAADECCTISLGLRMYVLASFVSFYNGLTTGELKDIADKIWIETGASPGSMREVVPIDVVLGRIRDFRVPPEVLVYLRDLARAHGKMPTLAAAEAVEAKAPTAWTVTMTHERAENSVSFAFARGDTEFTVKEAQYHTLASWRSIVRGHGVVKLYLGSGDGYIRAKEGQATFRVSHAGLVGLNVTVPLADIAPALGQALDRASETGAWD
jgi:hypothetical protein